MKKAFDANVSRAKPRVRLGALMTQTISHETVESLAQQVAHEAPPVIPSVETTMDLGSALKLRAQARSTRTSAAEALQEAIAAPARDEVQARSTWSAPVEAQVPPLMEHVEARASVAEARGHEELQRGFVAPQPPPPEARVSAEAPRAFVVPQPEARVSAEMSRGFVDAAPTSQPRAFVAAQPAYAEAPRGFADAVPTSQPRAFAAAQSTYAEAPRAFVAAQPAYAEVPRAFVAAQPAYAEVPRAFVAPQPEPRAHAEAPPSVTEVQTAPPPSVEADAEERRERLRERLKAVRENPRPEPLPDTVAEAGVLAVERISALQTELSKARAMNLALAQDLEAARRQAERATEEARLRMDEAKRLSSEMNGRVTLLSELERELESLEGERNESLLALQESRQVLELREREKHELAQTVAKKDQEISDSLAEEERLASELEGAQETMGALRRSSDALKGERDTLARQVSELTRERAELLEARKALEAVHRALSSAAMR